MRIAIAGTGGLARHIASLIHDETSHCVVFLSRQPHLELIAAGHQVSVINYTDRSSLQYALLGVDTVISTVTGLNQIELIHAAVEARVRRFAAAEFEGPPARRPVHDVLDRHRTLAKRWLEAYASRMQSTSFICGILYERFQPGGLRRSLVGFTSGFDGEGDYMLDCNAMTAELPVFDPSNQPNVTICMTAATDVARCVTLALDLARWPAEFTICGDRMSVLELTRLVEAMKGRQFQPKRVHSLPSLQGELQLALARADTSRGIRLSALIATAQGRYDFSGPTSFSVYFPTVSLVSFHDWFVAQWGPPSQ